MTDSSPSVRSAVLVDGTDITRRRTRAVATRLGVRPERPIAPEGITVGDLVARGRHPHQRWLRQFSAEDELAVESALVATRITELVDRDRKSTRLNPSH